MGLSAGNLVKLGLEHSDIDKKSLGEAAVVLNKYLNDLALIMSEKNSRHGSSGMANLIFDLDNDLMGILKGQVKLDKSERVHFISRRQIFKGRLQTHTFRCQRSSKSRVF